MADARLAASSVEVAVQGLSSRRVAGLSAESITTQASTPARQLAAVSIDTLTTTATIPRRGLAAVSVEVLVPRRFSYVGWGSPITTASWV